MVQTTTLVVLFGVSTTCAAAWVVYYLEAFEEPCALLAGFSTTLAAAYLAYYDDAFEESDEPDQEEAAPYEASYPLDTGDLPETAANLLAGRVEDATPDGRVVLRLKEGLFEYWADKPVAYKYLEAVARKYVIVFDCRGEYVNMFRELLKASEALPAPVAVPASVFASFKPAKPESSKGLVNERANRYHWMGRLAELAPPPPRPEPKAIRYADFKKKV